MDKSKVETAAAALLEALFGEEKYKGDENFNGTPQRMANAFSELLSGEMDPAGQIRDLFRKRFPSTYDGSISCTNHKTYSICPHHLLPVTYTLSIVYMPAKEGYVIGASKIGRLADILAHRAILQETLVEDIIVSLNTYIKPRGVGVYLKGYHHCMTSRGLKTQGAFETIKFTGVYKDIDRCRNEALFLFNRS